MLNELAARCHAANHKWWHDLHTGERLDRNKGELMMLVISEVSEAMEGERKNLKDDKLPHRPMAEVEIADGLIRCFDYAGAFAIDLSQLDDGAQADLNTLAKALADEQEGFPENKGEALLGICAFAVRVRTAADAEREAYALNGLVHHLLVYAGKHGHDLQSAFEEKMAFNAVRADHQREARLQANGKKW